MIPVKDKPDWARSGKAVVNTDVEGYQAHMKKLAAEQARRSEADNMKATINNLNQRVDAMSDTLNQILNLLKK